MSSFNDFDTTSSGKEPSKEELMDQVRGQMAVANAQELLQCKFVMKIGKLKSNTGGWGLIQKMTDKCFKKCVVKPGADLSSTDRVCLAKCMDRYLEAWNIVSRSYATRLQKDANRGEHQ